MTTNPIVIESDAFGTLTLLSAEPVYALSSSKNKIYLYAPFSLANSISVAFRLANGVDVSFRKMTPSSISEDEIIPEGGSKELNNIWEYAIPSSVLNAVAQKGASEFVISFKEEEIEDQPEYLGRYDTASDTSPVINAELKAEFGVIVTAGAFVIGKIYTIATVGTTDFTLIGAADNELGTVFTATGIGTGTGTATEIQTGDFVNVWQSTDNEFFSWLSDGSNFIKQTSILNAISIGTTGDLTLAVNANVQAGSEEIDITVTTIVFSELSELWQIVEALQAGGITEGSDAWLTSLGFIDEGDIGRLSWNVTDNTLDLKLNDDVTIQLGQEEVLYAYNPNATIVDTKVVYVSGASGQRPTVALASNDDKAKSHNSIGVATEDLITLESHFVTTRGLVRNVDTSAWSDGDILYLGNNGDMTNVIPEVPLFNVQIGYVINGGSGGAGIVYVDVEKVHQIAEAPDVKLTSIAANEILKRNSTNEYFENVLLTFQELSDTPVDYTGKANFHTVVNEAETGLEFRHPDNNSSTSIVSGCQISVADATHIDVAAGVFKVIDITDPSNPKTTFTDFAGLSNVLITTIATGEITYISLDSGGTPVFRNRLWTPTERRQEVVLGRVGHPDKVSIVDSLSTPIIANQPVQFSLDYHETLEIENGVTIGGVIAAKSFNKTSGVLRQFGINSDISQVDPNHREIASDPLASITPILTDGSGGLTVETAVTVFDPNYWDNAGVKTEIPLPSQALKAVNHRVYANAKGGLILIYGQTLYDNLQDAIDARVNGTDVLSDIPTDFLATFILRSIVSMKAGATDFSIVADAVFFEPVGTGGGTTTSGVLTTDNNVSITSTFVNLIGTTQKLLNEDIDAVFSDILLKIDSPLIDAAVPYAGINGKFAESKDGSPVAIHSINISEIKDYKGGTLNQQVVLGNAETDFLSDDTSSGIDVESDGTWVLSSLYDATKQTFNIISGNKYFVKVKLLASSVGDLKDKIQIRYDGGGVDELGTNVNGFNEVYGIITATETNLANMKIREGAVGQLDRDYQMLIDITNTHLDGLTADQVNNRIDGYINGLQSVGSPVDYDQLLDKRVSFSAWDLSSVSNVEDYDGSSYIRRNEQGTSFDFDSVATVLNDDTLYTVLVHIPENTLDEKLQFFRTAKYDTGADLDIEPGVTGIFKLLVTTGTIVSNEFDVVCQLSSALGTALYNFAIVEGDATGWSDEFALEKIQEEDFGEFTVKGVFIESVDKNKFDGCLELGLLSSTTGLPTVSTAQVRTVNYTKVNSGETYNLKSFGGLNARYFMYDKDLNFISPSSFPGTSSFNIVIPDNVRYLKWYATSVDIEELYQLELGTSASDYEKLIKQNAHVNEELGDVPDGTADDFDFVKTIKYLLESADITAITNLSTVQQVTISKPVNGSGNGNLNTEWTRVEGWIEFISGTGDSADNIGKYRTFGANDDYLFYVALGTYATLGDAQTSFTGTKTRYRIATPLKRDGIEAPKLDLTGKLLTSVDATFSQLSTSGITNYFTADLPLNLFGQVLLNVMADLSQQKEINWNKAMIEKLLEMVAAVVEDVGFTDDLNTTAKVIVDAINELLVSVTDNGNDIAGILGKTNFITITENIDLDEVETSTLIMNTPFNVESTITPTLNMTLTSALTNFDYIDIHVRQQTPSPDAIQVFRLGTNAGDMDNYVQMVRDVTTLANIINMFKLVDTIDTSHLAAYHCVDVTTTYLGPVIATASASDVWIDKIYGIKK